MSDFEPLTEYPTSVSSPNLSEHESIPVLVGDSQSPDDDSPPTIEELVPETNDPLRAELIHRISDLTQLETVDSATWSCLWLADIKRLEELVESMVVNRPGPVFAALRSQENARALRSWAGRSRIRTDEFTTTPQKRHNENENEEDTISVTRRSDKAKQLCLQRDNSRCLLTKGGEPIDVCHIFPHTVGRTSKEAQNVFWATLTTFWSSDQINSWKRVVFGDQGTEICANLMTLCPNAHRLWGKSRFALKPVDVSADGTVLTVQFYWLPDSTFTKKVRIMNRPSIPANLEHGPNFAMLFDHVSKTQICSGCEIEIRTDDPTNNPLPSIELLHMQWVLNRLTAICGAADIDEQALDDSDEEEDCPAEKSIQLSQTENIPLLPRRSHPTSKSRDPSSINLPYRSSSTLR